ncbi:MAG: RagB/SusD family nutrient uptake outer membrane protein [Marinifilaceae bacterium]
MKRTIYFRTIVLLTITTLSACSEWLNVQPEDQVSEENLYDKCDGYYTQLNGVYKAAASKSLWGKELSWGLVDVIGQYYDMGSYSSCKNYAYRNAASYDYYFDRTRSLTNSIWEKSYNAIANCNNLINNTIQADSNLFSYKEKERLVILGEAYALRALLHFEVFRLYAPAYCINKTDKYLPYQETFPTHIPLNISSEEFMNNVITDLKLAADYTAAYDTLYPGNISNLSQRLELSGSSADRFMSYRGYRLNHYAINALIARVYLFMEDFDNAKAYAQKTVDLHAQKKWFGFTSSYNVTSNRNIKMYDDVIFALYNNFLTDYFIEESPNKEYYMSAQDIKGIFGGETTRDIRYKTWEDRNYGDMVSLKYTKQDEAKTPGKISNKMVPIIRLSEMYYILSECFARSEDFENARTYLHYIRTKRGLNSALSDTDTFDQFLLALEIEYRREFYGEGQLFHFYKRLNRKIPTSGSNRIDLGKGAQLPIPDSNVL